MSAISPQCDSERSVLVTGGTSGLGRSLVSELAGRGWRVIFTGRNVAAGESLKSSLGPGSSYFLPLNQSDLAACVELPRRIAALTGPPLAAIVCNAGTQTVGPTVTTAQGLEATLSLNHLSHHLLVELLLPVLQDGSRVLVVASGTHDPAQRTGMPAPELDAITVMSRPDFLSNKPASRAGRVRYTTSKLCNVLFTYELAERLRNDRRAVTVNAMDPGLMPTTGLSRSYPRAVQTMYRRLGPVLQSIAPNVNSTTRSARAAADLVTNPEYRGANGLYFQATRVVRSSTQSYDHEAARRLWSESEALLRSLGFRSADGSDQLGMNQASRPLSESR